MRKNSNSESGVTNPRSFAVFILCSVGALLAMLTFAGIPSMAEAQNNPLNGVTGPKARTTVSEVVNHRFPNGDPGALGYKITHEVLAAMAPDEEFPSLRVDASQFPDAFDGQWADDGFHAAWVSPLGKFQYLPNARTIESGYFDNYIQSDPNGAPLQAGDSVEIAVKQLAGDTPLTWSRPRSAATGELRWEVATRSQTVQARYGDVSQAMDVVFVRADLVARGGDFDARDGSVRLPPLVIDLPRSYGPEVTGSAAISQFAPYLHYISGIEGTVLPQSGKAVFIANTRGYLPEAKEYTLAGGTHIREWHIPLNILIALIPTNTPVSGQLISALPPGGVVWSVKDRRTERIEVAPGGAVMMGNGVEPTTFSPTVAATNNDAPAPLAGNTQLDEVIATASIDHTLAEPAPVLVGKRSYALTVDPNLEGQGLLGIRSFNHVRTGQGFFNLACVPFVKLNGETIALDRNRLVDLRVLPLANYITIGFTSRNDGDDASYGRARFGHIKRAGVTLEAVYELGNDRYAFVSVFGRQEAPEDNGNAVDMSLEVRSFSGAPAEISAVQYGELAQPGPVTYDGQTMTTEFAGPSMELQTSQARIFGGATGGGQFTVVRGGAALTSAPVADPSVSIGGRPVGIYVTSRSAPNSGYYQSSLTSWLTDTAPTQTTPIGDIDKPCIDPPIVDDESSDAPADLDIERAWFDFDGVNLYTTIQVARLDEAGTAGAATFRASWRFEHVGFGVQAQRNDTGNWSYALGLHSSAGAAWNPIPSVPVTGELRFGTPGYIRMSHRVDVQFASTGFLSGEMLRDTGATSFNAIGAIDRAPAGAPDLAFGRGGDYFIMPCPGSPVQLLSVASRKTHGGTGTFDLDLPLTGPPGIECRSGGVNGNYKLIFSFLNTLTSVGNASVTSGTGIVSSHMVGANAHKYIVNLTGVTNAQVIRVSLTNVNDSAGNSSSSIPISMGVLIGDTTANGSVNSSDIGQTKSRSGQAAAASNFRSDVTANGSINSSDISSVKSKSGTGLPQ